MNRFALGNFGDSLLYSRLSPFRRPASHGSE
jgi:hypothetical protein